eukprot:Rmarinus@m.7556
MKPSHFPDDPLSDDDNFIHPFLRDLPDDICSDEEDEYPDESGAWVFWREFWLQAERFDEDVGTVLSRVFELKLQGNHAYKSKNPTHAAEAYTLGLRELMLTPLEENPDYLSLYSALLSNRAQCFIKLRNLDGALNDCVQCLSVNPYHKKCRIRLSKLLVDTGRYGFAREVLDELDADIEGSEVRGLRTVVKTKRYFSKELRHALRAVDRGWFADRMFEDVADLTADKSWKRLLSKAGITASNVNRSARVLHALERLGGYDVAVAVDAACSGQNQVIDAAGSVPAAAASQIVNVSALAGGCVQDGLDRQNKVVSPPVDQESSAAVRVGTDGVLSEGSKTGSPTETASATDAGTLSPLTPAEMDNQSACEANWKSHKVAWEEVGTPLDDGSGLHLTMSGSQAETSLARMGESGAAVPPTSRSNALTVEQQRECGGSVQTSQAVGPVLSNLTSQSGNGHTALGSTEGLLVDNSEARLHCEDARKLNDGPNGPYNDGNSSKSRSDGDEDTGVGDDSFDDPCRRWFSLSRVACAFTRTLRAFGLHWRCRVGPDLRPMLRLEDHATLSLVRELTFDWPPEKVGTFLRLVSDSMGWGWDREDRWEQVAGLVVLADGWLEENKIALLQEVTTGWHPDRVELELLMRVTLEFRRVEVFRLCGRLWMDYYAQAAGERPAARNPSGAAVQACSQNVLYLHAAATAAGSDAEVKAIERDLIPRPSPACVGLDCEGVCFSYNARLCAADDRASDSESDPDSNSDSHSDSNPVTDALSAPSIGYGYDDNNPDRDSYHSDSAPSAPRASRHHPCHSLYSSSDYLPAPETSLSPVATSKGMVELHPVTAAVEQAADAHFRPNCAGSSYTACIHNEQPRFQAAADPTCVGTGTESATLGSRGPGDIPTVPTGPSGRDCQQTSPSSSCPVWTVAPPLEVQQEGWHANDDKAHTAYTQNDLTVEDI